jgi:cell division septum initiation protein DivIVA
MSEHEQLVRERARLLERVEQLEQEVQRYREHAQRTSKLFLYVTDYADWVRQSARRDAELALRKARARAAKILGDLEKERRRVDNELLRLQALTDETRTRLSAFTTAALDILNSEVDTSEHVPQQALSDLPDALRPQLTSASGSASTRLPSAGTRDR